MTKATTSFSALGRDYRGRRVLILGLGQYPQGSGAAAARFFARANARLIITDQKSAAALARPLRRLRGLGATYVLGRHRLGDVDRADFVIQNPGVRRDSPLLRRARQRRIPVLTDTLIFSRASPAPIIGVTGTRGKSTTSALIAEMLRRSGRQTWLGGNISVSPLSFLHRVRPGDAVVLELSSWMLESLGAARLSPQVAVYTNLLPDHLNTYPNMAAYARAKATIFRFQKKTDTAIFSHDNVWTRRAYRRASRSTRVWTSLRPVRSGDAVFVRSGRIIERRAGRETVIASTDEVALLGTHNLSNVLSAVAAARSVGVRPGAIRAAIRNFRGLSHRLELVAVRRGVNYVDDTTATTPEAVIAALQTLSADKPGKRIVLIAGGADKKLFFGKLARRIPRRVRTLVTLPGKATEKLLSALRRFNGPPITRTESMSAAVAAAARASRRADTVLLSPGAASFGLFRNEFDRGRQFRREVRKLGYRG